MILTKGEALRRGILILFLAIVLIGIVFGIGFGTYMCVMNSCYKHSTPFEDFESYDEVKSVFSRNKKVLSPISPRSSSTKALRIMRSPTHRTFAESPFVTS